MENVNLFFTVFLYNFVKISNYKLIYCINTITLLSLQLTMKKFAHISLSLFLTVVVFYTGTGINISKYCCVNCKASHGIFSSGHLCNLPSKFAEEKEQATCPKCKEHPTEVVSGQLFFMNNTVSGCSTARISVDLDFHFSKPQISAPFVWLSGCCVSESIDWIKTIDQSGNIQVNNKEGPPLHSSDTYLSLIQVFII